MQSVFQSMPLNVIMEDLRVTRSVELTIENILEGHLTAPPVCINVMYTCFIPSAQPII